MLAVIISSVLFVIGIALTTFSCFYGYERLGVRRAACRTGEDLGFAFGYPGWFLEDSGITIGINDARLELYLSRSFAADNGDRRPHRHSEFHFDGRWACPSPVGPWFRYQRRGGLPYDPREFQVELVVPAPLALLPAAILPATAAFRRIVRKAGCCQTCGYDLRATPDRCPECGKMPLL